MLKFMWVTSLGDEPFVNRSPLHYDYLCTVKLPVYFNISVVKIFGILQRAGLNWDKVSKTLTFLISSELKWCVYKREQVWTKISKRQTNTNKDKTTDLYQIYRIRDNGEIGIGQVASVLNHVNWITELQSGSMHLQTWSLDKTSATSDNWFCSSNYQPQRSNDVGSTTYQRYSTWLYTEAFYTALVSFGMNDLAPRWIMSYISECLQFVQISTASSKLMVWYCGLLKDRTSDRSFSPFNIASSESCQCLRRSEAAITLLSTMSSASATLQLENCVNALHRWSAENGLALNQINRKCHIMHYYVMTMTVAGPFILQSWVDHIYWWYWYWSTLRAEADSHQFYNCPSDLQS